MPRASTGPALCLASPPSTTPAPACKIGWVRVPGGGILEIFSFEPNSREIQLERGPWTAARWFIEYDGLDADEPVLEAGDLGVVAEHPKPALLLHRLQVDALTGDIGRFLVFLVDLHEARRRAFGLGDGLLAVGFRTESKGSIPALLHLVWDGQRWSDPEVIYVPQYEPQVVVITDTIDDPAAADGVVVHDRFCGSMKKRPPTAMSSSGRSLATVATEFSLAPRPTP